MVIRDDVDEVPEERDSGARPRAHRRPLVAGALVVAVAAIVGLGMGPAGALDRLPGPWQRDHHRGERHGGGRDHPRDDEERCPGAGPSTTTSTMPASGAASVSQTVMVVVPPIVRVRSASRHELTVVTNSGRPPAPGDEVYVEAPGGGLSPAGPDLVARVMSARWRDSSWCSTTEEHTAIRSGHRSTGG